MILFLLKHWDFGIMRFKNCFIIIIFVSFERKGYYCVVFVGQLIFDCRSYCGLSRRMQGLNPSSKTDELSMPSFDSQSDRAFVWQSDRVLRIVCKLFKITLPMQRTPSNLKMIVLKGTCTKHEMTPRSEGTSKRERAPDCEGLWTTNYIKPLLLFFSYSFLICFKLGLTEQVKWTWTELRRLPS